MSDALNVPHHQPETAQPEEAPQPRMPGPGQPLQDMVAPFDRSTVQRYARHIATPGIGMLGQRRTSAARVAVIGLGGLASPVLEYLAAAGVGELMVADVDAVELSNLHRKPMFSTPDVGRRKVEAAADAAQRINPHVAVRLVEGYVEAHDAVELLTPYDVIVDCTDDPGTRRVLASASAELGIPHVWGAVTQFHGRVAVWWPPHGPCSECSQDIEENGGVYSEHGVFGPTCGQIGSVMAAEALKLVLGLDESLLGWILQLDTLTQRWTEDRRAADPQCTVCRPHTSGEEAWSRTQAVPVQTDEHWEPSLIPVTTMQAMLERPEDFEPFVLVDVRGEHERELGALEPSYHLPLEEVRAGRAREVLGPHDSVVTYCRNGVRSAEAARLLHEQGFANVYVLEGGLMEWANQVEPDLPIW